MERKKYTAPTVIVYGNVEEITKSNNIGSRLDMTFTEGTELDDVTVGNNPPS